MKLEIFCCGKKLRPEYNGDPLKFRAKCEKCKNTVDYKLKKLSEV